MKQYLKSEWSHYNDAENKRWQLLLVFLSMVEDVYRKSPLYLPWSFTLPARWLMPLFLLRGWITGGKTRRLLRCVVRHWIKNGIYETQLFDCGDRALAITFEWKDIRVMKGYDWHN